MLKGRDRTLCQSGIFLKRLHTFGALTMSPHTKTIDVVPQTLDVAKQDDARSFYVPPNRQSKDSSSRIFSALNFDPWLLS